MNQIKFWGRRAGKATAMAALVAAASAGHAQTATISTTAMEVSGTAASTALQSVTSPTYFVNDGQTILTMRGSSGSPTARIRTYANQICGQGVGCAAVSDQIVTLVSGTVYNVGPFPTARWNDPNTGLVRVDWSAIAAISATAKTLAQ